jgi:hypothetical protein
MKGKYVHRVVVENLLLETPYSLRLYVPYPYEVHHIDYNKLNNTPHNLLLLSPDFHSALTAHGLQGARGLFTKKGERVRPVYRQIPLMEMDREVPF